MTYVCLFLYIYINESKLPSMPSVLRGGLISLAQRWSPIRKHWSGRVEGSWSILHENHNCACPNGKGLCLVFDYDRQFENATN